MYLMGIEMKRMLIIVLFLSINLILSGCSGVSGNIIKDDIICNSPYLRVGSECCLDQNNNSICDKDEELNNNQKQDTTNYDSTNVQSVDDGPTIPFSIGELKLIEDSSAYNETGVIVFNQKDLKIATDDEK